MHPPSLHTLNMPVTPKYAAMVHVIIWFTRQRFSIGKRRVISSVYPSNGVQSRFGESLIMVTGKEFATYFNVYPAFGQERIISSTEIKILKNAEITGTSSRGFHGLVEC